MRSSCSMQHLLARTLTEIHTHSPLCLHHACLPGAYLAFVRITKNRVQWGSLSACMCWLPISCLPAPKAAEIAWLWSWKPSTFSFSFNNSTLILDRKRETLNVGLAKPCLPASFLSHILWLLLSGRLKKPNPLHRVSRQRNRTKLTKNSGKKDNFEHSFTRRFQLTQQLTAAKTGDLASSPLPPLLVVGSTFPPPVSCGFWQSADQITNPPTGSPHRVCSQEGARSTWAGTREEMGLPSWEQGVGTGLGGEQISPFSSYAGWAVDETTAQGDLGHFPQICTIMSIGNFTGWGIICIYRSSCPKIAPCFITLINKTTTNVVLDCKANELIVGATSAEVSSVFSLGKDCNACALTCNYEVYRKTSHDLNRNFVLALNLQLPGR